MVLQRPAHTIEGNVLGSYRQGDSRFGATAGVQCACNTLTALCWSVIRSVTLWQKCDLYFILAVGDLNYKSLDTLELLSVNELPRYNQGNRYNFLTEFLVLENEEVSADSNQVPFLNVNYDECDQKCMGFLLFITSLK